MEVNIYSELHEQGILWFKGGNHEKAKECWEVAATQGNASAMFCMGILCLSSKYDNLGTLYGCKLELSCSR